MTCIFRFCASSLWSLPLLPFLYSFLQSSCGCLPTTVEYQPLSIMVRQYPPVDNCMEHYTPIPPTLTNCTAPHQHISPVSNPPLANYRSPNTLSRALNPFSVSSHRIRSTTDTTPTPRPSQSKYITCSIPTLGRSILAQSPACFSTKHLDARPDFGRCDSRSRLSTSPS